MLFYGTWLFSAVNSNELPTPDAPPVLCFVPPPLATLLVSIALYKKHFEIFSGIIAAVATNSILLVLLGLIYKISLDIIIIFVIIMFPSILFIFIAP